MAEFVRAASLDEIPPDGGKLIEIKGIRIAIFLFDDEYYAIEDVCTHDGGPLVEGKIVNGCQVQCPRHGARFDIRTGAAVSLPAFSPTNVFDLRVEGDELWIESPY